MTLIDLLELLGSGALLGGIVSFLFERVGWFQKLTPDQRFWVIGGLCLGIPLTAKALVIHVPVEILVALEPYWQAILAGGTAWLGSQVGHKVLNGGRKTRRVADRPTN